MRMYFVRLILAPDPTFKIVPLLQRGKGAPGLACHGQAISASNYVTSREKGCGFMTVRYFRSKIIQRGSIGSEKSVRYSELRDCPLLGGS